MNIKAWAKFLTTPLPKQHPKSKKIDLYVKLGFTEEQRLQIYRKAFYLKGHGKLWHQKRENWMLLFILTSKGDMATLAKETGRDDIPELYYLYRKAWQTL